MPIYVYECRECNDVYEVEQRIVEDALTDCRCGAKGSLKRLIQPVAVVFNGAGFHINDYSPSASKPEPAATETPKESTPASPAAPADAGTASTASETKSE